MTKITKKHEMDEAEIVLEHAKELEGIVTRFCAQGEKKAKKFSSFKVSIAEEMERGHLGKELDRIRTKIEKNKEETVVLLGKQRELMKKARAEDEAKLKEVSWKFAQIGVKVQITGINVVLGPSSPSAG